MQATAANRLTDTYLHQLSRYNRFATFFAVLITLFSLFWMLFRFGGKETTTLFAYIAYALGAYIGAAWAFQTVYRARHGAIRLNRQYQVAWLFIGLGLVANCIEGMYYSYQQYTGQNPFPCYAEIFALLFYPCIFLGLLLIPTTIRFRIRMVLDALITSLCLLGVSWFFLIGPTYITRLSQATSLTKRLDLGVSLANLGGDMLLILAIVFLIQRGSERILHFSLLLIAIGLLANIWADSAYAYQYTFLGIYQVGTTYIDTFWLAGYLLIGLAALYQYTAIAQKTYYAQTHPLQTRSHTGDSTFNQGSPPISTWKAFQSMLIYLPLTILLGLVVFSETLRDNDISDSLSVITACAGALIAIRHFFASRENEILLQEREQRHKEAERLQYIVTYLTETLEMSHLRERIVTMSTVELGFDAAILLLVEERNSPFSEQSYLQVSASDISTHTTQWRFQGSSILSRIFLTGRRTEVNWSNSISDTPIEIRKWYVRQGIATMLFFPLIYKERILGSLGIARRTTSPLNRYDISLITTYTEQVSAILEQAHVYQETREHEAFARAMANIATRLNAAVIEPAEISQLICQEGANALRADYVLLYIATGQGQLKLLAASFGGYEPTPTLINWPTLHISEYESQAPQAFEPILLDVLPQQIATTHPLASSQRHQKTASPQSLRGERRGEPSSYALRAKLAEHAIQTAILAPLVAGGNPIGMLVFTRSLPLGTRDRRHFDTSDLPQAQEFVKQAGVAFNNAQLYQHVRAAHQRLQELDQLKDQFMITASHELRTPLTAVQGYIELMVEYGENLPPDQRKEFLYKAQRGCEELVLLLGNVMDASRLEMDAGIKSALIKRISVQEIVESVLLLTEPHVTQEKRKVHVHIPPHLFVYADPVRLRQVLMNVSVNALKYSLAGTPIGFSACAIIDNGPRILISIWDKGKGIAPQDQAHLFQRFFRLESDMNSPVRGSGLGLYISRRLIEAMNGKIWIESKGIEGEGSIFHIQLPMAY